MLILFLRHPRGDGSSGGDDSRGRNPKTREAAFREQRREAAPREPRPEPTDRVAQRAQQAQQQHFPSSGSQEPYVGNTPPKREAETRLAAAGQSGEGLVLGIQRECDACAQRPAPQSDAESQASTRASTCPTVATSAKHGAPSGRRWGPPRKDGSTRDIQREAPTRRDEVPPTQGIPLDVRREAAAQWGAGKQKASTPATPHEQSTRDADVPPAEANQANSTKSNGKRRRDE